jgi:hypothetical protein
MLFGTEYMQCGQIIILLSLDAILLSYQTLSFLAPRI